MEYLMTYGWAILIIAVVLGALFSLGVFNGNNFAPKASPGACQVFRPNGPETTMDINLAGECQGLEPQYVAQFSGSYANPSVINITDPPPLHGSFTVTAWIDPSNWNYHNIMGTNCFRFETYPNGSQMSLTFSFAASCGSGGVVNSPGLGLTANVLSFVAITFNGSSAHAQPYYNGLPAGGGGSIGRNSNSITRMGFGENIYSGIGGTDVMGGYIANVQLYNISLNANQIQALYQEGIGGAPVYLQNLVGWWPLNGNANDYSGNNYNGQASNVIYTSSWTSGYSAP